MKQNKLRTLYEKDMTKKILASLLSILIGLVVGSVIIAAVGFSNPELGASSVWDGIRIVFAGLFSTGRTAAGVLTWGFNSTNFGNMLFRATPLIMTGLSVAVAFKTGLFNIGAPGQYLMGTLVSLCIALGIPSSSVAPWLIWILAFLGGIAAGALHTVSLRCPHLGCRLHFNKEEKTWECPCHGSRFDCRGRCIDGPAQTDIHPLS